MTWKDIQLGLPPKEGWYYAWEVWSGCSSRAYWDADLQQWLFPKEFPPPPSDCGYIVDMWREDDTP